jgi:hypothetical protein
VHTGLALAATLRRLHPDAWNSDRYDTLLGHKETWEGLRRGDGWIDLEKAWQPQLQQFIERRKPFLLYAE